jgi:tryptophanyl-tRNA synthetase
MSMEVITMESILNSIKKLLGPEGSYDAFNNDLILHINTYLRVLNKLGVGVERFRITDETATWNDFLGENDDLLDDVETYIYLRVKVVFDPPASSIVMNSMKEEIKELTWYLRMSAEHEAK